jgi:hypothetical protein
MKTIINLSRLPVSAFRILRWRKPSLGLSSRLELIRLLFVDAINPES